MFKIDSISIQQIFEFTNNYDGTTLVIMEGSLEFIASQLNLLEQQRPPTMNLDKTRMCLLFTERIRVFNFGLKALWVRVGHHKEAGGATTTMTQVALKPKEIWSRTQEESQKWFLNDFLKSTVRGKRVEPGVAQLILLNTKNVTGLFRAPCVFTSTGWVEHRLTPSEVLRCLDIPQGMDQKLILELGGDLSSLWWKYVLKAVPGKTIMFVLKSLINKEEPDKFPTKLTQIEVEMQYQVTISGDFITEAATAEEERNLKAVKADNAEVPIKLWNNKIVRGDSNEKQDHALEIIRNTIMIRWYRRSVYKSFLSYMRKTHGKGWTLKLIRARQQRMTESDIFKDGKVGTDALRRILGATWWSWEAGSTLLFWRWAMNIRKEARDGTIFPWKIPPFPRYVLPQRYSKDQREKDLMIETVRDPDFKQYIDDGYVRSLSTFFCIPKGDQDIRIVYDMTKCGLNACLWSPRFYMPTPDSVFDSIEYES